MAVALVAGTVNAELAEDDGHGFAPVDGSPLDEAKGAGPAVVLIHGGQLDCRMWDDQFAALFRHFRVIRYDVRGYGGSYRPDMLYSDAQILPGCLITSGPQGPSGGPIARGAHCAIDFAVAHPGGAGSLTLAGPACRVMSPPDGTDTGSPYVEHYQGSSRRRAGEGYCVVAERPFHVPGHGASPACPRASRMARENAHCWLENPVLQRSPKPVAATRLGEIKVPILLVIGDRDVPQI